MKEEASADTIYHTWMESPIGYIEIKADDLGLTSVWFCEAKQKGENKPNTITQQCEQELHEYFSGERKVFTIPLNPEGTPFQKRVWKVLQDLRFGQSASYLDISKILGDEKLTRAVGSANGKNPIGIIVPCHRVIGSDGSLTGYAGGMQRKKWLLQHEGVITQQELF
jgi:methylated-DNA-[protein]-cysteine S-methyltransferase